MEATLHELDADWPRLRALAERLGERADDDPDFVFFPVGLRLHGRDGSPRDGLTPANSTTFASTGGNGVHFSLLQTATRTIGTAPVVMTVPMQFQEPNHLVGGSLREFLALGCRTGYHHLESLAYGWGRKQEASHLERGSWTGTGWDGETGETAVLALLETLAAEFDLAPWPSVEQRLAALQTSYLPEVTGQRRP